MSDNISHMPNAAIAFDNVSHINIKFVENIKLRENSFETIVETFKAHSKQLHLDDLKGSLKGL